LAFTTASNPFAGLPATLSAFIGCCFRFGGCHEAETTASDQQGRYMPQRYADVAWAIVLDPDITEQVIADSAVIAETLNLPESEHLKLVLNESFRQMRARFILEDDIPKVQKDSDPVAGLTVLERSHLVLNLRTGLSLEEISKTLGISEKRAKRELKSARLHLARTAIALTLLTNPSRCPITQQFQVALEGDISRDQLMNVVSHSAECSICVEVLRVVDKQIVNDYINAESFEVSDSYHSVLEAGKKKSQDLVTRAKIKGNKVSVEMSGRNPKYYMKRAIALGVISSILLFVATRLLS